MGYLLVGLMGYLLVGLMGYLLELDIMIWSALAQR